MNRFKKIGVVGAGSLALLAGGGYAVAADKDGNAGSNQSSAESGQSARPELKRIDPEQGSKDRDQFYADLGEKLGKSQDEVKAAFKSLLSDKLSEEVKAGRLTEAQKDAILQGFDAGLPGGPFGHGPGGPGGPGGGPGHGPGPGGPPGQ